MPLQVHKQSSESKDWIDMELVRVLWHLAPASQGLRRLRILGADDGGTWGSDFLAVRWLYHLNQPSPSLTCVRIHS
jgi:hypothetical protein